MVEPPATDPALRRLEALSERFESELRAFVDSISADPTPNLHEAAAYALALDTGDPAHRGKRIRPALCLLAADALGAPVERALPFALAIELMHNFCLVHDDIEDGDRMRRGRASAWVKYGVAHAINAGDYLHVQTHRALAEWGGDALDPALRLRLLRLLGLTLDRTHVGQAMDINARADREITVERYMEIVRQKTGFYLAAPIQGGAIVAGADDATIERIGAMAALLGPMFQIADDVIDLTGAKGRERAGSDIREGKRSYLVAFAAARADPAGRRRMFDVLDRPRDETSEEEVEGLIAEFESLGAIESARRRCRELYREAETILATLPPALAGALSPVLESLAQRDR